MHLIPVLVVPSFPSPLDIYTRNLPQSRFIFSHGLEGKHKRATHLRNGMEKGLVSVSAHTCLSVIKVIFKVPVKKALNFREFLGKKENFYKRKFCEKLCCYFVLLSSYFKRNPLE